MRYRNRIKYSDEQKSEIWQVVDRCSGIESVYHSARSGRQTPPTRPLKHIFGTAARKIGSIEPYPFQWYQQRLIPLTLAGDIP
jgi:hypothetical protein